MSDELEQTPSEDTSAVETTDSPVDWQQRYESLQPDYTRKSQRLSALESDPTAVLEWVQQYHPDLLDDDDTETDDQTGYEEDDEDDPRWSELQELKAWKEEQTQRQSAEETRAEWAGWEAYVKEQAGIDLTARDIKALKIDSAGKNGRPVDPEKAVQVLKEHLAEISAYEDAALERARKKRKRVATSPGDGKAGTQVPDLDNPVERVAWMTQQAAERAAD